MTKQTAPKSNIGAVSVIVCAKNEEDTIPELLKSLTDQNYESYEIVLVNDSSRDKTLDIFNEYSSKNNNAVVVDVSKNERFWRGKKFALTMGIKRAKNDILLFTDADCTPVSENWISSIINNYNKNTDFVLGYGAYSKHKGLLNKIIRFETITTASNYMSFAKIFTPYMGVGRNLSYKKDVFFKNRGFYTHMDIASGDDDLFVNSNATRYNTEISVSKESWSISEPPLNWKDWIVQKRRHYTTSSSYSNTTKLLLGLQYFSLIVFYTMFFVLIINKIELEIVIGIFLFRTILYITSLGLIAKKLEEKDLIIFSPFFDVFLIIFQIIILLSNKIIFPKRWA